MKIIYWHCLDRGKEDERFLSQALSELADLLRKPPAEIETIFEPLPHEYVQRVETRLRQDDTFINYAGFSADVLVCDSCRAVGLFVFCRPVSAIVTAARKTKNFGTWGLSNQPFAAVWEPGNKYIIWHECLHLLGVNDCYDEGGDRNRTTCGLDNCIMQYVPTETSVGQRPFLCSRNVKTLRDKCI